MVRSHEMLELFIVSSMQPIVAVTIDIFLLNQHYTYPNQIYNYSLRYSDDRKKMEHFF